MPSSEPIAGVERDANGDGTSGDGVDHRSAVGFDPLARLTEAHRLAIDAAQASFQSFARVLGDGGRSVASATSEDLPHDDAAEADDVGFAELRRTVTRSLDLYLEIAERLMDTATRSLEDTLRSRGVTTTGGRRDQPWTPLHIEVQPGGTASASIWLHNVTDEPIAEATFVATDLVAHHGSRVSASCVTVDPETVTRVAPRASLTAALSLRLETDVPEGTYLGYVLVSPLPGIAVPIRLDVGEREAG